MWRGLTVCYQDSVWNTESSNATEIHCNLQHPHHPGTATTTTHRVGETQGVWKLFVSCTHARTHTHTHTLMYPPHPHTHPTHTHKAHLHISLPRLRIYVVLAGLMVWEAYDCQVNVCQGLDWKRSLALHLWYHCQPSAPLREALGEYMQAFQV